MPAAGRRERNDAYSRPKELQYFLRVMVLSAVFAMPGFANGTTVIGDREITFGGRLMVDSAWYGHSAGIGYGNGTEVRRARLFASGVLYKNWQFKAEVDFAGNTIAIKDAWIGYTGLYAVFKAGQFKEPFSLEELTNANYITFMEKALPNIFAPGRHIGVGLSAHGSVWTLNAGVFGGAVGSSGAGVDSGLDVTGRLTFSPVQEATRVFHVGVAASYRRPDAQRQLRVRERPESHMTGIRLVDTGLLGNVDHYLSCGGEMAMVYGPLSVQAEYVQSLVTYSAGSASTHIGGYYAYASWFITGESRNYQGASGIFGRLKPAHDLGPAGWGAVELAGRFSQLDLEDGMIAGGVENNVTVGLNWHVNPYIRFMANYIRVLAKRCPLLPAGRLNPDVFQLRAQVDF